MKHVFGILIYCLCHLLCSCGSLAIKTPRPTTAHQAPTAEKVANCERVIVFSHGWHTGIVIPNSALKRHPWTSELMMGGVPYAEFGWGAEEFYRKPHFTPGMVIRGLFWPTAAVVHLERFAESPYAHYPTSQLVTLELGRHETDQLIDELRKSFQANSDGTLINLGPGIKENSNFFRSRFKYYYPQTCNIWTAKLLNAAGLNIKESTRSPELMASLEKSSKVVR